MWRCYWTQNLKEQRELIKGIWSTPPVLSKRDISNLLSLVKSHTIPERITDTQTSEKQECKRGKNSKSNEEYTWTMCNFSPYWDKRRPSINSGMSTSYSINHTPFKQPAAIPRLRPAPHTITILLLLSRTQRSSQKFPLCFLPTWFPCWSQSIHQPSDQLGLLQVRWMVWNEASTLYSRNPT